ncbi:MAG TPA: AAA family ATPase [Caldilineae bacterium]|nr:AAA family ATPase [Caldilineae bacterium]
MKKSFSPAFVLLLLLFVLGAPAVSGAQGVTDAWRTFDRYDGLESNWVYDAVQTSDRALWFGTDAGVARFDGAWRMFGPEDGLPEGEVYDLLVDRNGDLWAATAGGIARWSEGQWRVEPVAGAEGAKVFAMAQMGDGALWAGGEVGLFARGMDDGTWQKLDAPVPQIEQLLVDAGGDVWLATENRLFHYRKGRWGPVALVVDKKLLGDRITVLTPGAEGGVWIGTAGSGLAHYENGEIQWFREEDGLPSADIQAIFPALNGDVWVGTNGGGAARLQDGQWQVLTVANGLASDYVSAILEDADGVIWFGAVGDISRYDEHTWRHWRDEPGAPQRSISTLTVDPDGRLWVGTDGDGLHRFDGVVWEKSSLPVDFIESSFVDADGVLWVGSKDGDLWLIEEQKKPSRKSPVALAGDVVVAITQTPDGSMWFGAFQHGLSRWDGEQWRHFGVADGLVSDAVRTLFVDSGGRLWVGTQEGVSVYENGAWRTFTPEDGLAAAEVTAIAEAADGGLWFATRGGGVSRLFEGEWTTFDASDGLLAPQVEAIWADPSGAMWFGVVSGLSVYDGQVWQNYGAANGIEIGRVHALAPVVGGGMYLGADNGVVRFLPDRTPPQVQVLSVNGRAMNDGRVQVTPEESIHITLSGRDLLSDAGDLVYFYRLAGYDEEWRGSRTPLVSYLALPEGLYRFEAKVRDNAMNDSDPILLEIEVSPGPATITLPLLGPVRTEFVLMGVALLTALLIALVWTVWSTVARIRMGRQAVERRFNPYVAGSPIRDTHMFYGRQGLLKEIEATLFRNSLLLHGERRIGKTSLLYQLMQRLEHKQDERYRYIPIYVDLEGAPETEFFHRIMESMLDTLVAPLDGMSGVENLRYFSPQSKEKYGDRDFRRDMRDIVEYLNRYYHQQPRLVFLLDEADILNSYHPLTQQQFRRILQDTFAGNVRAVVTGVHISKTWDRVESPWYNMFVELELKPFERYEAERLMRESVEGFYTWDDDAVDFVWSVSQGRPHRIQQIALEAVNLMLNDHRRRITKKDAMSANAHILARASI